MKIAKKIIIVSALCTVAGFAVFGFSFPSYVTTAWDKGSDSVKQAVPIRFEIDRISKEVTATEPVLESARRDLARQEVALEELATKIGKGEKELATTRAQISHLKNKLQENLDTGTFACSDETGQGNATRDALRVSLQHHRNWGETLRAHKKVLQARRSSVAALRDRIRGLASWRLEKQSELEQMRAQLSLLEAIDFQDSGPRVQGSKLARMETQISDLSRRIRSEIKFRQSAIEQQIDMARASASLSSNDQELMSEAEQLLSQTGGN
jgi:chromosome segregation ATPase